ncbi:hypothetical protein PCC7424_0743 [Gloeothece citriformis PCC 7424]|uniref:Uncharacterized protein n=1 Tax=Gloeothece citriformis (strain PCC 7424) TaxID=65393 RepID=B7KG06_GLOC7|nr:hypothetical protein PCC7424_0743 [Gloeothece citriformis PCC 7424]
MVLILLYGGSSVTWTQTSLSTIAQFVPGQQFEHGFNTFVWGKFRYTKSDC